MNAQKRMAIIRLAEIQSKLHVPKDRKNDFGNYNYRSCEDILRAAKPLAMAVESVITLTDEVVSIDGWKYVHAKATLHTPDGAIESDAYAREAETKKGMDVAQVTGSASSYARKYALNGLLGIDDTADADETQDDEVPLEYQGKLKVEIVEKFPPHIVRAVMKDFDIERLTLLPEVEFNNFYRTCKGLFESESEGEL